MWIWEVISILFEKTWPVINLKWFLKWCCLNLLSFVFSNLKFTSLTEWRWPALALTSGQCWAISDGSGRLENWSWQITRALGYPLRTVCQQTNDSNTAPAHLLIVVTVVFYVFNDFILGKIISLDKIMIYFSYKLLENLLALTCKTVTFLVHFSTF